VARSYTRRERGLNPYEVGLLEVLRDFDRVSEEPFERLIEVVRQAADSDRIRLDRIEQAAEQEWDLATRQRWDRLRERLGPAVAV
jgi:type I restriction-modification system DNA methylase subunit